MSDCKIEPIHSPDMTDNVWLPIDTAPKDGTAILVMRDDWPGSPTGRAETLCNHNTYVVSWWENDGEDGTGSWVCYMRAVLDPECPIVPTHWKPLGPTPSQEEAAQPDPVSIRPIDDDTLVCPPPLHGVGSTGGGGVVRFDIPDLTLRQIMAALEAGQEAADVELDRAREAWGDTKPLRVQWYANQSEQIRAARAALAAQARWLFPRPF